MQGYATLSAGIRSDVYKKLQVTARQVIEDIVRVQFEPYADQDEQREWLAFWNEKLRNQAEVLADLARMLRREGRGLVVDEDVRVTMLQLYGVDIAG